MKTLICIKLLFLLFINNAFCEYRVYQYLITDKMRKGLKDSSYIVTSTLNPISYLSYHGGSYSTGLSLLRSWHCLGHTGQNKKFCNPPLEKITKAIPL